METNNLHTFALCAYGESPYLEDCVRSLLSQTEKSQILIATATPSDYIKQIAERYNLPYHVREGKPGITDDWNFAMSLIQTPYGTLAHQDDIYDPQYSARILEKAQKHKDPILIFSDYFEIRNGERVYKNKLLKIKRKINTVFSLFPKSRFMRRRALSIGNSICCPAVTYRMEKCKNFRFDAYFRFACDWDAWERLGNQKGSFLYIKQPLMGHRIHEGSETTKQTEGSRRKEEEFIMFRRFWPTFLAKRISGYYEKGAESNQL